MSNQLPIFQTPTDVGLMYHGENSGAVFSEDQQYRYALWRRWDQTRGFLVFIGLNPSTADAYTDDATIGKVKKIARNLGYGGVVMLNLFALISTDPALLLTAEDPIGPKNDETLRLVVQGCDVVAAWGAFKEAKSRAAEVIKLIPDAFALFINKDGSPKHPLYCPDASQMLPYKPKKQINATSL